MTARTLTCQVVEVEDLTPDVFRVHLEGRAEAMAHAPGQYLEMQLDPATWVPFSIANAHDGDGRLELHIQHWPERSNSARLRELLAEARKLTLRLPGHGITALMGPNGAGKSLSLRVMAGLVRPDLGQVRSIAIATSLVFQRPVLLRRSVRANLDHALRAARVPRRERPGRVAELLGLGALEGLADQPARALSGGEAQRLALVVQWAQRGRHSLKWLRARLLGAGEP